MLIVFLLFPLDNGIYPQSGFTGIFKFGETVACAEDVSSTTSEDVPCVSVCNILTVHDVRSQISEIIVEISFIKKPLLTLKILKKRFSLNLKYRKCYDMKNLKGSQMDWTQVLTIIGANLGVFLWLRSESFSDRRQMQQEAANDRRDILSLIREIKDEMKDFHAKNLMQDAVFKSHLLKFYENKHKE